MSQYQGSTLPEGQAMATYAPLTNQETAAFCSQMSLILKSGISSLEGLSIMADDAGTDDEKALLTDMNNTLMMTGSLYEAVKASNIFPEYMVSMVQIGEQTGRLDDVMESLAKYYERESSLSSTIRNAVTYPCVLVLMMLAVILILVTKVMPIFDQVFKQLGTEMTGLSRAVLSVGKFLNSHMILLALLLALLAVAAFLVVRGSTDTKAGSSDKLKLSSLMSEDIAAYRFANGMALTLSSGLSPAACMKSALDLLPASEMRTRCEKCSALVDQGMDFCDAALECGIYSGIQARLLTIASRTGNLDEVMSEIADQYESTIDDRMARTISGIEPALVVFLSIAVGIILLSVMLPLIGIMSAI